MAVNELEARLLKRIRELEAKVDFLGRAFNNLSSKMASKSQVKGIFDTIILPLDHGRDLVGQEDDDHAGYPWMLGRAGSQSINGGVAANEDLTLDSTAHATKGDIFIQPSGGNVGIGTSSPDSHVHLCVANATPVVRLERNDTTIGTDDIVARIEVEGQNAGSAGICAKLEAIATGNSGETGWRFSTGVAGSATETMRLTDLGYLGLGVTEPDTQLHVEHITGAVQRMTRKDDAVGTDDIVGRIEFETQDSGSPGIAAYIQGIAEGTSGEVGLSLATGVGGSAVERLRITNTGIFDLASLPVYANNAAAITGGLTAGNLYRTNSDPDTVCIVH